MDISERVSEWEKSALHDCNTPIHWPVHALLLLETSWLEVIVHLWFCHSPLLQGQHLLFFQLWIHLIDDIPSGRAGSLYIVGKGPVFTLFNMKWDVVFIFFHLLWFQLKLLCNDLVCVLLNYLHVNERWSEDYIYRALRAAVSSKRRILICDLTSVYCYQSSERKKSAPCPCKQARILCSHDEAMLVFNQLRSIR